MHMGVGTSTLNPREFTFFVTMRTRMPSRSHNDDDDDDDDDDGGGLEDDEEEGKDVDGNSLSWRIRFLSAESRLLRLRCLSALSPLSRLLCLWCFSVSLMLLIPPLEIGFSS